MKSNIIDLLQRQKNGKVTDGTINGKCSKCGECCTALLPVSDSELKTIKLYVSRNNIKPVEHKHGEENTIDLVCPFNTGHGCSIYKARPNICKSFICSMNPDKMVENRERFKAKNPIRNMWYECYGRLDNTFGLVERDGNTIISRASEISL